MADSVGQWFLMALGPDCQPKNLFRHRYRWQCARSGCSRQHLYGRQQCRNKLSHHSRRLSDDIFTGFICFGFCRVGFPGNLQHLTKTDAAASKLIYSTGINDLKGLAGSTTNTGLAVDAAGNAYITGTLFEAQYPFTQAAPTGTSSYLTKLDAAGASLLFSIPVGGGGVQLDSSGAVFVGGTVVSVAPIGFPGLPGPPPPVAIPPAFSGIPQVCLPNFATSLSDAYVMKIDAATGSVQDQQWIDGSAPGAAGITIASGKAWITGPTPGPDTPISPGALTTQPLGPGFLAGVYLSAVDFASPASGPSIACVSDGGNFSHVGAVASFQLLSIFGANLGPATPAAAADGDAKLGNVSVTFDGVPAQLFYVSASQINVAVPPPVPLPGSVQKSSITMQLTYKGAGVRRQFPLSASNLNLFADLSSSLNPCPDAALTDVGFHPVAENADGSKNSCTNPAAAGSVVSLFVHGAGGFGAPPVPLLNLHASIGAGCTALVTNTTLLKGIVYKLEVSLPVTFESCGEHFSGTAGIPLTRSYNDAPVGPFNIPADLAGPALSFSPPGDPMRMIVWVKQ